MIDDDGDFINPTQNFTQSVNAIAGMDIPEHTIRHLIGAYLTWVRETVDDPKSVLIELFKQIGPEPLRQVRGFFREHSNIQVQVNWPHVDQSLPWVAIINQGEQENAEHAYLGDRAGIEYMGGGSERMTAKERLAIAESRVIEVVIGTLNPDLTMYLHYLIKRAILVNKYVLIANTDMQNLMVSGRDIEMDQSQLPTNGYYKSLSLNFDTTFDYSGPSTANAISQVALRVAALKNGVIGITEVPE